MQIMDPPDLELQDVYGNTAFGLAVATGNLQIVKMMMIRNQNLPWIRCGQGATPLQLAALEGRNEIALHLYHETIQVFERADWIELFFCCVKSGIYDLALKILGENQDLAFERDYTNRETAMHILARKPCKCGVRGTEQLQLVKLLWSIYLERDDDGLLMEAIRSPSHVIFNAVEVGNFEFLTVFISTYPDLVWELDEGDKSIIYVAIVRRYADIFNLVLDIGPIKDFIASFADEGKDNILHVAARLAPPDRLNIVPGAALQMTLELLWFEEVKKINRPSFIEMKNEEGLTPLELFTMEHKELLSKAESWMKKTTESCMVVATLTTTGVFTAAFSIPGGINDNSGNPNYLKTVPFLTFAIADATAMIASSVSILIFLSIIFSRYAEDDFRKSLPLKLISGLVALFISIVSMMVAFSSAFFIMYYHGLRWVASFVGTLVIVSVPLFVFLLSSLWYDIAYSIDVCRTLLRPSKDVLY